MEIKNNLNIEKSINYKERHINDYINKSFLWKIKKMFGKTFIVIVLVYLITNIWILNGIVPTESMEPTINSKSGIIANRLEYLTKKPLRGDVVVFYSEELDSLLVKRIIGLPNEKIYIKNEKIFINDVLINEEYAYGITKSETDEYIIPENSYFVLGDNREHSSDSRYWKNPFVNIKEIKGKVLINYDIKTKGIIKQIDTIQPNFIK